MSPNIKDDRVLALKYRPEKFEDLIGQNTISQTLSLALDSKRLSHAYLFSGLRGSGKLQQLELWLKHFYAKMVQLATLVKFVKTALVQKVGNILILLKWMLQVIEELMI